MRCQAWGIYMGAGGWDHRTPSMEEGARPEMGLTRRGMRKREFHHNRAPGQARDRAIADWPEGRGRGHERVKEKEDAEKGSKAEIWARAEGV